jgi:hypothetical protein
VAGIARRLLRLPWFARNVVMERWFLHAADAPLLVEQRGGAVPIPERGVSNF